MVVVLLLVVKRSPVLPTPFTSSFLNPMELCNNLLVIQRHTRVDTREIRNQYVIQPGVSEGLGLVARGKQVRVSSRPIPC